MIAAAAAVSVVYSPTSIVGLVEKIEVKSPVTPDDHDISPVKTASDGADCSPIQALVMVNSFEAL